MKNETKAKKIIQTEIEKYSILKPTSMTESIIKALTEANLIYPNFPVSGRFLIRVKKASLKSYWYSKYIGREYTVTEEDKTDYRDTRDKSHLFRKSDVVVLKTLR